MRYTLHILLSVGLVIAMSCASTKSLDPSDSVSQAEIFVRRGQYIQAEEIYQKLLDGESPLSGLKGLIDLYLERGREEEAITLLRNHQDRTETKKYVLSALAFLYKNQGEYQMAIDYYTSYQAQVEPDSRAYRQSEMAIEELQEVLALSQNGYDINPQPLSDQVNSSADEYLPSFSLDQEVLIFTRKENGQEDLFEAKNKNGDYEVSPISIINTRYNEGAQTISGDGQTLVFTHCSDDHGYGSCDLYISHREGELWSKPKNIGKPVNTSYWDSSPSLTADGRTLYFSSNRPSGYGESDIWVSHRIDRDHWSEPKNLGETINTSEKEASPFIHADGETLYFRSEGHLGLGGYDAFLSRKIGNNWSTPENLGAPINTSGDDGDLVIDIAGRKAYFSSDRVQERGLDIYTYELPERFRPQAMTYLKGDVVSKKSGEPLQAEVIVTVLSTAEEVFRGESSDLGAFLCAVPVGKSVAIHITHPDYQFYSLHEEYQISQLAAEPIEERIELIPLPTASAIADDQPIVLNNIFFESNSAILSPASDVEIKYLYDLLQNQPEYHIEIIGHTDDVGQESDNLKLSKDRAESVRQAIIAKGINADRIQAIGKGEMSPIADNNTDEGRAQNRRTEFVLKKP